jgi:hypothetical protein
MTNTIISTDRTPRHKLTAEQIEKECPERLRQIAKEIEERLSKADKQTKQAQNHMIAVQQLLAEAKGLCDGGGFKKFRELFCPQLGKSQAYALLAISAGKKTLAEHRANERDRKQRTREKQKAAANSGTVPENSYSAPESQEAPTRTRANEAPAANSGTVPEKSAPEEVPTIACEVEATSVALEQTREHTEPRAAVNPRDELLYNFSTILAPLIRITKNQKAARFAKTRIPADDLARLGKLLTEVATLKKTGASKSTERVISCGNATVSPEQSAHDMKAKFAAIEEQVDVAA